MTEFEMLRAYWPMFVWVAGIAIGAVVWMIRLEALAKANAGEIRRLWRQREEDQKAARDAREITNRILDEVRQDIKTLLTRRD